MKKKGNNNVGKALLKKLLLVKLSSIVEPSLLFYGPASAESA